jgi:phosphoglucomutase/phosphomannomutase
METLSVEDSLKLLDAASGNGKISPAAAQNIRRWLTAPPYQAFAPTLIEHIAQGRWAQLDEAFWTVLPFGTAGRRGPMYPIGTATINDRTIGESAQGLADFIARKVVPPASARCAVAYDTRHNSRRFAELCCEVMAASGFKVFLLDGFRATPQLSFTVRDMRCDCGIMVSASHNPPHDNAVKVFGPSGGQLRPPDDAELMRCVSDVTDVRRIPFATAVQSGQIICCQREMDSRYQAAVLAQSFAGPRDAVIVYSPLHGVGLTSVLPVLQADGFSQVEVFAPHAAPDGDFPNVPDGCANPEDPSVFAPLIARARDLDANLAIASDPDADRIGCAAPTQPHGPWQVLSGNQIGALLTDFILRRRWLLGTLSSQHFIIKTLVTSEMSRRIADVHGVQTFGDVPTGFKWIGGLVDEQGPDRFVFGFEEAHGFMAGNYIRDKDAALAAMLLAELAAELKPRGQTLIQDLHRLYATIGYHAERTFTLFLPGADGSEQIRQIMNRLRRHPPAKLAAMSVEQIRDYERGEQVSEGKTQPLSGPRTDLLFFDLEKEGNYAAVRPSGTEPKLKFYLFAFRPPESSTNLVRISEEVRQQLDAMEADLRRAASG